MIKRICKHFRFLHFITISEERKKKRKAQVGAANFCIQYYAGRFNKQNRSDKRVSPINREFYLAKGTEKFILGRYLLSGILLILLSLRPWGVAARPAISRGIPEFINSDEFSSSIPIDPDHLDPSTLQRDQKE
jgi:hypothetical protein